MKPPILEERFLAAAKYAYEFVTSEKERSGRAESYNRETVEHIASHLQTALAPQPAAPVLVPLGANVTRDGREARVLCIDRVCPGNAYPVLAIIRVNANEEISRVFYSDGRMLEEGEHPLDLVGHLPPEPVKPREFWINQYNLEDDTVHPSRQSAEDGSAPYRTECIHVREVLPGQDDELEHLRGWKRQAMASTPDWQAIGKEMGLKLGQDVPSKVLPHIRNLKLRIAELGDQP